ncbi:hypothetical protein LG634_04585 [Streptomyces bambusae]|uniref:hypothetical protein n=1 Tax=Streptomyces bambusae TaxID=1550616 RepID=UPI001CFC66A3|nr:hypothetical protein [Streptomyces bambusae]MCB5164112.1 hypothetical protein [Streptomyces bambusae]
MADPRIVYVHGNGNKHRKELLKSQWDRSLFGTDMGSASRMAYWAPVRYDTPLPDPAPDPLDGGPPSEEELPGAPALSGPPGEFVARTVSEARADSMAEAPPGPPPEGEQQLVRWLRDMTYLGDTMAGDGGTAGPGTEALEALPLPGFARREVFRLLVKHTFKDVHAYFFGGAGDAMRDVVRAELAAVDGGPLVVVGHSLGSVIAYEVLRELERPVELLITVGSPLAITEVQDLLRQPPAVPSGVAAWHNASDLRDLVALDHTVRPEYAPEHLVTDHLVTNSSGNHHGIREYLATDPVRTPVRTVFGHLAPPPNG